MILIVLSIAIFALGAPKMVMGSSTRSTGEIELILNQEQTLIIGEEYEYKLELTNLDNCDKELSTGFSCIPTIALIIKEVDIETQEITDSKPLEHMNYGVHDLYILYDEVTIVSLNVVNISMTDNSAKIEIAYKVGSTETLVLDIIADDTINANKSERCDVDLIISNNSDDILVSTLRINDTASAQYILIDNEEYSENDEYSLSIQPGKMTITISFVPSVEGHHLLSIIIDNYQKDIPVLVHSPVSSTLASSYVNESSLKEALEDETIIDDIRLDSAFLLGSSFMLLVFGGVLGFIASNRSPSSKEDD
ncbi:MAG TPA: hypothetical protein PLC12_00885 [Candidatus Methanofastidiosa archaeon]|nr:hypothetical protein [Candidatus Methanofastidiosa archaeon]